MERILRSALRLFGASVFALCVLHLAPAPTGAQPTVGWVCDEDSDCTGVDEACAFDRCVQIRCNSDQDCLVRLPFCLSGLCQDSACSNDDDCQNGDCVDGECTEFECDENSDCGAGSCVDNKCRDCERDAQCGANGVCQQNSCVCVACTRAEQCAFNEACSAQERSCVPFCAAGRVFVSATDGNRICKTCVNPDTHQRCSQFPGCGRNTICAQGFCINRCSIDPPDFDSIGDDFPTRWPYEPDPDGNPPECPRCTAVFDLAGLRTTLERAGVTQPVTVRILQPSGKPLAEFGPFKPNRGSWSSIPLRAQPVLGADLGAAGGCGYTLEVQTTGPGSKTARAPICLQPQGK